MTNTIFTLPLHKYNLPSITIELMEVSPDQAREWLLKNTKNRNLRKGIVGQYGRDMAAGDWAINGSTVVFSDNDILIDGQHRLHAIAALTTPGAVVPLLVVRGVKEHVKRTIDSGTKRTMGDRLKIDDTSAGNSNVLAALLRRAVMWNRGQFVNAGGTLSPSPAEMYAYLEDNPGVLWSTEFANANRRRILAPISVVAVAHWVTSQRSASAAEWFFGQLIEPTEVPSGHAIHALNRKLTKEASGRIGRANETEMLAAFVIAWNHYRADRSVTRIQMPTGGLKNSNFPLPK